MSAGDSAEWDGMKKAALGNAIRERLHTIVDELDVNASTSDARRRRLEIQALVEQFPEAER